MGTHDRKQKKRIPRNASPRSTDAAVKATSDSALTTQQTACNHDPVFALIDAAVRCRAEFDRAAEAQKQWEQEYVAAHGMPLPRNSPADMETMRAFYRWQAALSELRITPPTTTAGAIALLRCLSSPKMHVVSVNKVEFRLICEGICMFLEGADHA